MAGSPLNGIQIRAMLIEAVNKLVTVGNVKIPSMHRVVFYDGFLNPLLTQLLNEFDSKTLMLESY